MKKWKRSLFCILVIMIAISAFAIIAWKNTNRTQNELLRNKAEENEQMEIQQAIEFVTELPEKQETEEETIDPLTILLSDVEAMLAECDGDWSVYVKNLDTDASFAIGNDKMVSASLIKLFIMAAVYEELDAGTLARTQDITNQLTQMITISHNEASNELVAALGGGDFQAGMQHINDYAASHGFPDTEQQRDMKDSRPVPIPEQNYTSVQDCGVLLEQIYRKTCVSEEADAEMLALLLAQTRRSKIPAGIPDLCEIANKTGELSDTENDVAIVFSPACDYILCVMSNNLSDTAAAQAMIREISSVVYGYFNE